MATHGVGELPAAISPMRGSNLAMFLGMNARLISARSLACSGPSLTSSEFPSGLLGSHAGLKMAENAADENSSGCLSAY